MSYTLARPADLDPRMLEGMEYGEFEYRKSEGRGLWRFKSELGRRAFAKKYGGCVMDVEFDPPSTDHIDSGDQLYPDVYLTYAPWVVAHDDDEAM